MWRHARISYYLKTYALPALLGAGGALAISSVLGQSAFVTQAQTVSAPAVVQSRAYDDGMSMEARHQYAKRGCREAAEVGLAPAYRGQPGYWPQWDGDDDGISCERWHSVYAH